MTQIAVERIEEYCLRPPSKRINYAALCQPHPFLPHFEAHATYKFYVALPIDRGVTATGSLIYLPTKEDLESKSGTFVLTEKSQTNKTDNLDFNVDYAFISNRKLNMSKRQLQLLSQMKSDDDLQILGRDLSVKTGQPERVQIGFVTRGGFSQLLGKPIGICAVNASVNAGLKVVLFRKPSSLQYHMCRLISLQ